MWPRTRTVFLPYEKFQLRSLSSRPESSFTEGFIFVVFVPVLCHCSTDCLCLFFIKSYYYLDPLFHLTYICFYFSTGTLWEMSRFFSHASVLWASSIHGHLTCGFIWRVLLSGNEEDMMTAVNSVLVSVQFNKQCGIIITARIWCVTDMNESSDHVCLVEKRCVINVVGHNGEQLWPGKTNKHLYIDWEYQTYLKKPPTTHQKRRKCSLFTD